MTSFSSGACLYAILILPMIAAGAELEAFKKLKACATAISYLPEAANVSGANQPERVITIEARTDHYEIHIMHASVRRPLQCETYSLNKTGAGAFKILDQTYALRVHTEGVRAELVPVTRRRQLASQIPIASKLYSDCDRAIADMIESVTNGLQSPHSKGPERDACYAWAVQLSNDRELGRLSRRKLSGIYTALKKDPPDLQIVPEDAVPRPKLQ